MVIWVQKIIDCELVITSEINNKCETIVISGRGYYKKEKEIIIYFTSDNIRYKYIVIKDKVEIYCNDSHYNFRFNKEDIGEIKNGDYIFKITTLANKIEITDNFVLINYELKQNNILIGKYLTKLSFN